MELETIDNFFNEHLLKVEYFDFGREARAAALRMAERDVAAELGREPDADRFLEERELQREARLLPRSVRGV